MPQFLSEFGKIPIMNKKMASPRAGNRQPDCYAIGTSDSAVELLVGGIQIESEESKPNGFLMIWYLGTVASAYRSNVHFFLFLKLNDLILWFYTSVDLMNLYNILIIFFGLILMGIYRFNHFPSFNFKRDCTYNFFFFG